MTARLRQSVSVGRLQAQIPGHRGPGPERPSYISDREKERLQSERRNCEEGKKEPQVTRGCN